MPASELVCLVVGLVAQSAKPVMSVGKGCLASLGLLAIGTGHLLIYGSGGVNKFVDDTKKELRQKLPTEEEENEMREAYKKEQEKRAAEELAYKIAISKKGASLALENMSTDIQESIQTSTSLALRDIQETITTSTSLVLQDFRKDMQETMLGFKNLLDNKERQIEQLQNENEKQRFQLQLLVQKQKPQLENKQQLALLTNDRSEYKTDHK